MDLKALAVIVVLAAAIGSCSMTITMEKVFERPRGWVRSKSAFFGKLVSCPYCMAHWLAFLGVIAYRPVVAASGMLVVDLLVSTFLTVTASSIFALLVFKCYGVVRGHDEDDDSEEE